MENLSSLVGQKQAQREERKSPIPRVPDSPGEKRKPNQPCVNFLCPHLGDNLVRSLLKPTRLKYFAGCFQIVFSWKFESHL